MCVSFIGLSSFKNFIERSGRAASGEASPVSKMKMLLSFSDCFAAIMLALLYTEMSFTRKHNLPADARLTFGYLAHHSNEVWTNLYI